MCVARFRAAIGPATLGTALLLFAAGCSSTDPAAPAAAVPTAPPPGSTSTLPTARVKIVETQPLKIDAIYPSMEGPSDRVPVDAADLDWVTAYRTEVIDNASGEPLGDEFFCHSQLQLPNTTRLLVTATGAAEIRFPPGFAMPVSRILGRLPPAERSLSFLGMVLNNHVPEIDETARVRATVEYYADADLGPRPPVKKLYKVGLPMTVEDLEAYEPGAAADTGDVSTHCVLVEGLKGHWMVPRGPQTTRRSFENLVPVDATVHYAVVHLHNHGRYLRLTNKTTGQLLWQTDVVYEDAQRVQIARIPVYSSAEGFPIYTDHVYEIEAYYDNTAEHDVDAMALLDLYYHPLGNEDITYAATLPEP